MSFGNPWALSGLLLLPGFVLLVRRSRAGLGRARTVSALGVRILILLLLVLALAEIRWPLYTNRTATMFLLDWSASIPPRSRQAALEYLQRHLSEMPRGDRAGVIRFGADAMIEVPLSREPRLDRVASVVRTDATDLSAAIRLAMAAFPEGFRRRIVLITDGNENRGDVLREVEAAAAHGITIDVIPIHFEYPGEVWIEAVHTPEHPRIREPFDLRIVVHAEQPVPADLQIVRNRRPVAVRRVQLERGKNVFTLRQKAGAPGPMEFEVTVTAPGDSLSQNNRAVVYTRVLGGSRVLVISEHERDSAELLEALQAEGLLPTRATPDDLGARLPELPDFDAILLVNVAAPRIPGGVMQALEAAVHDAGTGFLMIGGENSFGPGGYRGTAVERILPVTMEQPGRRILPNGALVLVLHTAEIADGNYWAKQIGIAALNVLTSRDQMGVIEYGSGGERWLFELQPVKDKAKMRSLIRRASPGDMPSFDIPYQMAHEALRKARASIKHVVVISDADPSGPSPSLVKAMVRDGITLSTVAIGPHGASDLAKMKWIAALGKGRYYFVRDPARLPQIFIREAATVHRAMVIEETFAPVVRGYPDFLKGIRPEDLPPLHGYVLTSPRPAGRVEMQAKYGDALLVRWRFGLGTAAAWTSDASSRWAKDWVAWGGYQRFWSQFVRSLLRSASRGEYPVTMDLERGRGWITIEAIDDAGEPDPTLTFKGSVTNPDGGRQEVVFRQVGPGRYEASFQAEQPGLYTMSAMFRNGKGKEGFLTRTASVPYSLEYRDLKTDLARIHRILDLGGGRLIGPEDPLFVRPGRVAESKVALWPYLLAVALVLFPIDVFIRRVAVNWAAVAALPGRIWRRIPRRSPGQVSRTLSGLLEKKRELQTDRPGTPPEQPAVPPPSPESLPARAGRRPSSPEPETRNEERKKGIESPGSTLEKLLEARRRARKKEGKE